MTTRWFVLDVNPEPWVVPPMSPGRAKGGKLYVAAGKDPALWHYQQAIKEALGTGHTLMEGRIKLTVGFWRTLSKYRGIPRQRQKSSHEADNTNMVKALEDALQGVLFDNDRTVVHTESAIIDQGPQVRGRILLGIERADPLPAFLANLPEDVYQKLREPNDPHQQPSLLDSEEDRRYAEAPAIF